MNVNQVYELINAVASDSLGKTAFTTVKDTSTLVSLGETVLSSDESTDAFYHKLLDKIGLVYVKYRRYVADFRDGIVVTPLDFGIAVEKVQVNSLSNATTNGAWGNQPNPYAKEKDTTDISVTIFSKIATFATETRIVYDYQLKGAFHNAEKMASFVNMIYNSMYNEMEYFLEQTSKLAKSTGIAQCVKSTNTNVKRNLLAEYKAINTDSTLTADSCLYDANFLKFASREINLITKRMSKMSTIFSPTKATRFTPIDTLVCEVLDSFSTACDSYLTADTYHAEMVKLPLYNSVTSWQHDGDFSFATTSSIKIKDETDGEEDDGTEISGVIAYIRDRDAVGMMIDNIRTKSAYNPFGELTNVSHRANIGYFVDKSENAVICYVAD